MRFAPEGMARCKEHPEGLVRRVFERRQTVLAGYPVGLGVERTLHYECDICGKPLNPTGEDET